MCLLLAQLCKLPAQKLFKIADDTHFSRMVLNDCELHGDEQISALLTHLRAYEDKFGLSNESSHSYARKPKQPMR